MAANVFDLNNLCISKMKENENKMGRNANELPNFSGHIDACSEGQKSLHNRCYKQNHADD